MRKDNSFKASNHLGTKEDIAAIRQLVEDAVKYQSDPDPFLDLHSHDVVIVNFAGKRVFGRDALESAMRKALSSSLANVLTKNVIEDIRFIRQDIAIVSCIKYVTDERIEAKDKEQASLPAEKGALTYVMVKEASGWMISLAQTTPMVTFSR